MNLVVLQGRLTKDVELRFASNGGRAVARFSVAINRYSKNGESSADFINCVAFGKTAENISQYFHKGKMISLRGSIKTNTYDASDGTRRYTTDVWVENFDFCGDSNNNNNNGFVGNDNYNNQPMNNGGNYNNYNNNGNNQPMNNGGNYNNYNNNVNNQPMNNGGNYNNNRNMNNNNGNNQPMNNNSSYNNVRFNDNRSTNIGGTVGDGNFNFQDDITPIDDGDMPF